MKAIVKTQYSLKQEGYNEFDRKIEEKDLKMMSHDNNAKVSIIDDNTLVSEWNSEWNIVEVKRYFNNFEDCTVEYVN